jgi:hypothetical protein
MKDQYKSFLWMVREWHHLKMLKRAGQAHNYTGVDSTKEGKYAVICPICPQSGKNLPNQ